MVGVCHLSRLTAAAVSACLILGLLLGCAHASPEGAARPNDDRTSAGATATTDTLNSNTTPLLMAMGDMTTTSPRVIFYAAAALQDRATIQALKRRGADINEIDAELHQTALHQAALDNDLPAARLLLEEGADPNRFGGPGSTALYDAIGLNHYDMARLLLENGADPNQHEQVFQFTPLHSAATEGNTTATLLLLRHKADPNARNLNDLTPLHLAASGAHLAVARLLVEAGADPTIKTKAGRSALDVARDRVSGYPEARALVELLQSARK